MHNILYKNLQEPLSKEDIDKYKKELKAGEQNLGFHIRCLPSTTEHWIKEESNITRGLRAADHLADQVDSVARYIGYIKETIRSWEDARTMRPSILINNVKDSLDVIECILES